MNIRHSKVKNTGVLFELLVRQITVDTLENKPNSTALNLMKKYFRPTTELGRELQMYRAFFDMNRLTEVKAAQFIDFVSNQRKKLDDYQLAREKYELIKELKNSYDLKDFLNIKIPFYKIYASIYKTFLVETGNFNISNIREIADSRFTLVEHLAHETKPTIAAGEARIIQEFKNESEDLRLLSYKLMLDRFNQKYQNLNESQKRLLKEYINSVSNSEAFAKYVQSEIEPLKTNITSLAAKEPNKVLKIKLKEVSSQLEKIAERKRIRDNDLTAVMIAYQLAEELKT